MKARELASTFEFDNGYEVSADYLAKLVADKHQVFTQHASKRSLATYMILGGVDPECGPSLHRVDPAGHVLGYKACAAGVKEAEAMNWLEKKYTGDELPSQEDAVSLAIDCLQTVLSTDLKATDLEVAVITERNPYVYPPPLHGDLPWHSSLTSRTHPLPSLLPCPTACEWSLMMRLMLSSLHWLKLTNVYAYQCSASGGPCLQFLAHARQPAPERRALSTAARQPIHVLKPQGISCPAKHTQRQLCGTRDGFVHTGNVYGSALYNFAGVTV